MADALLGLVGKDFVLIAADTSASRSVVVFKNDEDKILALDSHKLLASAGPVGDRTNFTEYIQKNIHLYSLRNNIPLTVKAAANFTRNELAEALRRNPYQVNLLVGGYDEKHGPQLFYMDYLASMHPLPFGAHGYASYFTLSVMDRYYKKDMTEAEGIQVIGKCIGEIQKRLVLNMPKFKLKIVDKNGIRNLPTPDT